MPARQRPAASGAGRFSFGNRFLLATLATVTTFATLTTEHLYGGPGGNGGPPVRIQVPGTINLAPILAQDILIGPDARSVGVTRRALNLNNPTVDAGIDTVPSAGVGIQPEVTRQVAGLWRVRIPPSAPGIPGVDIAYQLTSPLGVNGALGLTTQPATTVDVDVVDLGYRITRRGQGQGQGQGQGRRDIEGDVEFRFQTSTLQAAGRYQGDLLITVNFL